MDALILAAALTEAITTRSIAAIRDLYAPTVTVWHSYDKVEQNLDETLSFLETVFATVAEMEYSAIRRVRTEDGFVQQHVLHVRMSDGTILEPRPACIVAEVRDGKIARLDEYIEARRASKA